jgi:cytochrome P450
LDPIYNPLDDGTLANPYPVFAHLRKVEPVYWHEQMKSWVLTRYDDCRSVLRNHELWARDWRRVGDSIPDEFVNMQSIDPPDVLPLRSGFVSAFKNIDFQSIREQTRRSIATGISGVKKHEHFCFMQDFAMPVAEAITCETFGLEIPREREFHEIAYGITLQMDSGLEPSQRYEGRKVAPRLRALVNQGFARRKKGGLFATVSDVFATTEYPQSILLASMDAMLNAAYSTIYTSIGNAVLTLVNHPGLIRNFNKYNLGTGADELLRFDSPAQGTSRVATAQAQIGDRQFARGDVVITMFAAANHDPDIFADPESINLNRSPNPHLGFGFGVHSCLGTELARVVLQEMVAGLMDEPELRLVGTPVRFRTATLRWLKALPVTFLPAATAPKLQ